MDYYNVRIPKPRLRTSHIRKLLPTAGNMVFTMTVIVLMFWAQSAGALPLPGYLNAPDAPSTGTIAYQGRLADASGNPLTSTVNMEFRLYNAATGGTPLWSELWTGSNAVQVSDGLFNVMLGSLEPISQNIMTGNISLWLGITAGTDDEMMPRVQLGSVPFAVQALTVPNGSVSSAKIADGAVATAKLADGSVTNAKISGGAVTTAKLADASVSPVKLDRAYVNKSGDSMTGSLNMNGASLVSVGNVFGIGPNSAQLHMPGSPNNGDVYINWHSGRNLIFGGGTGQDLFHVDTNGNLYARGTKSALVQTQEYGQRKLYAIEAPDVRFSDEGMAQLGNGEVRINLDPIFIEIIEDDYLIQVTPYGDASLYVSEIGRDYFIVAAREGDQSASFAWRLSATRKGYTGVRLEQVDPSVIQATALTQE